jgi:hypothetical protein
MSRPLQVEFSDAIYHVTNREQRLGGDCVGRPGSGGGGLSMAGVFFCFDEYPLSSFPSDPRTVAAYVTRQVDRQPFPMIARALGYTHPSRISGACRRIEQAMQTSRAYSHSYRASTLRYHRS